MMIILKVLINPGIISAHIESINPSSLTVRKYGIIGALKIIVITIAIIMGFFIRNSLLDNGNAVRTVNNILNIVPTTVIKMVTPNDLQSTSL